MEYISFRGKGEHGNWWSGYYKKFAYTIITDWGQDWKVKPETVGLSLQIHDINLKTVFEGDIVKVAGIDPNTGEKITKVCAIVWRSCSFMLQDRDNDENFYHFDWYNDMQLEVIGNIHDNPELMEVE